MEEQVVHLLTDTQSSQEGPRKNAEAQLKQLYSNVDFPLALVSIGAHTQIPINTRQSALLYLKTWVQACWSPQFDEHAGQLYRDQAKKAQIRQALLTLACSERDERKVKSAASLVVSKIATADFPDEWPDLLPTVLSVVATGTDAQLHGALKVLSELVDDCFNEEQFFKVARDLVTGVYHVAANESRKHTMRALAVSVFRSCFDTLEMLMEDHKAAVKGFAEEALSSWIPLFIEILKSPLPVSPSADDEIEDSAAAEHYRGSVALKLQVVKVLMRTRTLFPSIISPHSPALFSATWAELSTLQASYLEMYIDDDRQGRLEDADGLPYTLDFLAVEELDFLQACLRAPPVRKELEQQLRSQPDPSSGWLAEMIKIAVAYAQITTEEEGLWEIDVNVFLSEEASVTANYTPRTACGDLIVKLGEWLSTATIEVLLAYTHTLHTATTSSWKSQEAVLFLLKEVLADLSDSNKTLPAATATAYIPLIQAAVQSPSPFLRARSYVTAGILTRTSGTVLHANAPAWLAATIASISHDPSPIVQVSSIRALQFYTQSGGLPTSLTLPSQPTIIAALATFLGAQTADAELSDSDDLLMTVIETLRDAALLDPAACLTHGGIDLLFEVASRGAGNFQIALLCTETFEDLASSIAGASSHAYATLSVTVLPTLMGAFDSAPLDEENDLANLAAELLSVLASNGSTPLPEGFVATALPRLMRLLMGADDDELLKSCTASVKHMLTHDAAQVFAFTDAITQKPGLEVVLIVIDRLLNNPAVDDNGASEVGGLAAELVEKAGAERLGPYLPQLLRAVAERLASATQAAFVQSLILVFARLAISAAGDVVAFLAEVQVGGKSGLEVVMTKWLEESKGFAGYEDIRVKCVSLSCCAYVRSGNGVVC